MRGYYLTSICLVLIFLPSCRVHQKIFVTQPKVDTPNTYSQQGESVLLPRWWETFGSDDLNFLVESTLENNFDLKATWFQVAEACAQVRIEQAQLYPELDLTLLGGRRKPFSARILNRSFTFYQLGTHLSYEVDLWRKNISRLEAARFNYQAAQQDLETVSWILSSTTVDLWFVLLESEALLNVIDTQVDSSRTLLKLIELRFAVGISSGLDVYQQRLQLYQTEANRPLVESVKQQTLHNLNTLRAQVPTADLFLQPIEDLQLPPLPHMNNPCALLGDRPELRAQFNRISSADAQVAAAIADKFVNLNLDIAYFLNADSVRSAFENFTYDLLMNLFYPIFDGGARTAEVSRRKSILNRELQIYGQLFLDALREVEDALVAEKEQKALLEHLAKQLTVAQENFEQSKLHYINGLIEYLSVIAAQQSLQSLERRMVNEKRILFQNRAKLYRALGGNYITPGYRSYCSEKETP